MHNLGSAFTWLRQFDRAIACFQASLVIRREVGDPHGTASLLSNLGAVAVRSGQLKDAREFLAEALPTWQRLGLVYGIVGTLEDVGVLLGKEGRELEAVKLLAVASAIRERDGIPHSPIEQQYLQGESDRLRAALGDEVFGRIWDEGRVMSTDEAIELALAAIASGATGKPA
jgi:hypothetical protein